MDPLTASVARRVCTTLFIFAHSTLHTSHTNAVSLWPSLLYATIVRLVIVHRSLSPTLLHLPKKFDPRSESSSAHFLTGSSTFTKQSRTTSSRDALELGIAVKTCTTLLSKHISQSLLLGDGLRSSIQQWVSSAHVGKGCEDISLTALQVRTIGTFPVLREPRQQGPSTTMPSKHPRQPPSRPTSTMHSPRRRCQAMPPRGPPIMPR